ncbi:MAG TPA: TIGR00374 family protein [Erysipelotrichaceae bacterium]|nr:TIGR00374 family protein [Erysipelotrichaceae bacterium]
MFGLKGKKSYIIDIAVMLVIGYISLRLSVGGEVKSVLHTLTSASPIWLVVLIGIMVGYYLVDGLALWLLARNYKKDFTFKQAFINALTGTLFNGLTPSSSGGQFAQVFVFNNQGIPPTIASGILMMCFISYQIALMAISAILMLGNLPYYISEGAAVTGMATTGFLINVSVTAAFILGGLSKSFQNFIIHTVINFLAKIHIVKNYEATSAKIENYFSEFRHEMVVLLKNQKVFWQVNACNFLKLFLIYATPFYACLALHIHVAPSQFFTFLGLASIINLINTFLPIPGASGGSEGCYMILFGFLGQVNASSSMFIWRFFSFYFGMIIGMANFMIAKDTKRK